MKALISKLLKNFTNDPFGSGIGLGIIIVSVFSFYMKRIDFNEMLYGIGAGAVFLGVDTTKLGNKGGASMAVTMLLIAFLMFGCATKPVITESKKKTDSTSTTFKEREVPIYIKGDSVKIYIENPCPEKTNQPLKPQTYKYTNKKGNAVANVIRDAKGGQTIECECLDFKAMVKVKDTEINRLRTEISTTKETTTVYQSHWYDIAARVLAILFIVLSIITIYTKFKP